MNAFPTELRLAYAVILTALVLASSVRFARRFVGGDWIETLLDALLVSFVVQYAAVCLPGLFGVLNVWSMAVTAVLACALLQSIARDKPAPPRSAAAPRPHEWPPIILVVFVTAYVLVAVYKQWIVPPLANDPLTYHLPAAVEWLQTGKIGLYEAWFYNPANTYSPLAGSVLAVWWLAPLGNDVLGRFVQAPALLLLLLAMIQAIRALGVSTTVAAMIATGAVVSRPFISQTILAKDDLLLAAFFATTVAGLTRIKLTDGLGPWRIGLALGMLLATKYTALLSLPLLLLAIDAPARAGWKLREYVLCILCVLALAGPWYLRNAMLTGNPLYPIDLPGFDGLFSTRRAAELSSLRGLWKTLVSGYYSTTVPVAAVLVLCWTGALITSARHLTRTPLVRLCLLGPPLGLALFVLLAPYPEVRFTYPALLLMFACGGSLAFALKHPLARLALAAIVLIAGLETGFVPRGLRELMPLTAGLTVLAGLSAIGLLRLPELPRRRVVVGGAIVLVAILGCLVYVYFDAFLHAPAGYANTRTRAWRGGYGPLADAWQFIDEHVPPDATIAYTNTFYTYPLFGFDLGRRVVYAPARPGLRHLHDLPPSEHRLRGDQIIPFVASELLAQPERDVWRANLARAEADYLLIVKAAAGPGQVVPELDWAAQASDFTPVFENEAAMVLRIAPPAPPATNATR